MSKSLKPVLIIVVAIVVASGAALYLSKQSSENSTSTSSAQPSTLAPQATGGGRSRGPADAPVTLVEFGDYQCPSCGYYAPVVNEVLKRYPKEVRLEFHHYPLVQIHPGAMPAALAAEAAGEQGKFWEMHDLIYEHQEQWSRNPNPEGEFLAFAGRIGLDVNAFMRAVRAPETQSRVLADVTRARETGVNETPTFFINGQKVTQRPNNADEFSRLIQEKLSK